MKPRVVSLGLALGVFGLVLWIAFRPGGGTRLAVTDATTPAASPTSPVVAEKVYAPGVAERMAALATPSPSIPAVMPVAGATTTPAAAQTPVDTVGTAVASIGGSAGTAARDSQVDVNKVRVMLRDYHTISGENPVGTNAEIMSAIMGGNKRQATLGPPEGMSLNGQGELVDQWNTPYFFHQLSKDVMEIRSAGPDKVMWTADDAVVK